MKSVLLSALLLASSVSFAHNRTLTESFVQTLPDAVADATLIDTPIALVLWGLGIAPAATIPLSAAAATGGYSIRKTCNDYLNEQSDWKLAALCGFVGGAGKYSGKAAVTGEFTRVEPFLGAADAGSYEATSNVRGNYMTAEYMAIEGGVAALCYALRPAGATPTTLWKEVKMGLTIGAFVSVFVKTTHELYASSVKALVKGGIERVQTTYAQYTPGVSAWAQSWWSENPTQEPLEKKEL